MQEAAAAVELVLMPVLLLMGLSHMARPRMWVAFFGGLEAKGSSGVVLRSLSVEIWPAFVIIALHPVWEGPGLALTLFGWLLAAKCTLSLLWPELGLRSLALARRGPRNFVVGGVVLTALGVSCGLALWL